MKKLIQVTQKHINKGKRKAFNSCPVALAIKDTGYSYVDVDQIAIEFGESLLNCSGMIPPRSVKRFVNKFDEKGRKHVKPFNFFLVQK